MNVQLERPGLLALALPLDPDEVATLPNDYAVWPPLRSGELDVLQLDPAFVGPLANRLAEGSLGYFLKAFHQLGP